MQNLITSWKKSLLLGIALLVCVSFLPASAMAQANSRGNSADSTLTAQLTEIATAALDIELNALTGTINASANTQPDSALYQAAMQQRVAEATNRRSALLAAGIRYGQYDLQVTISDVEVDGNSALLYAQEYTIIHLDNAQSDPLAPLTTEAVDDHVFHFQAVDGQWILQEDQVRLSPNQPIDPDLGPVNGPSTATDTGVSFKYQLYMPFVVTDIVTGNQQVQTAATDQVLVNLSAVSAYAQQWWNSANSDYRNWLPDNDCTNFVSQALRAGGWQYTTQYPTSKWWTSAWWYASSDQTRTWTAADWFYSFVPASGRGTLAAKTSDLRVGDILEMDWTGDGSVDHATVVTYKDSSGRLF